MWFCGCLRKRLVWLGFVVLYVPKPVLPFFLLFFVSLFFSFFLSYVFTSPWKACRLSSLCLYCLKKGKSWSFLVVQQVTNSASSLLWLWVAAVVQASSLAWELPLAVGETKKKKKKSLSGVRAEVWFLAKCPSLRNQTTPHYLHPLICSISYDRFDEMN